MNNRFLGNALMVAVVPLLFACGGSDDDSPVAAPTTEAPTTVVGPITSFGSVVVNGIRLDDSAATFTMDDAADHSRPPAHRIYGAGARPHPL